MGEYLRLIEKKNYRGCWECDFVEFLIPFKKLNIKGKHEICCCKIILTVSCQLIKKTCIPVFRLDNEDDCINEKMIIKVK